MGPDHVPHGRIRSQNQRDDLLKAVETAGPDEAEVRSQSQNGSADPGCISLSNDAAWHDKPGYQGQKSGRPDQQDSPDQSVL